MKETLHIYTRVSSAIQLEGTSIKVQTDIGIKLAENLGMLYEIHNEGGKSSAKDNLSNRPVLNKLLIKMDQGIVKHLYVYNTDRLSRNQITWYSIRQKMVQNSVTLYTPKGVHDTQDSMENMILGILSEISQYDNAVRSERSRLGKIERVKQNYWRGGPPPYGYKIVKEGKGSVLVENIEESIWVKHLFRSYAERTPLSETKKLLEFNNIKTRRGNSHWSLGTLQSMIRNDIYLGYDDFTDKKSGESYRIKIPQLISNNLYREANNVRTNRLTKMNINSSRIKDLGIYSNYLICKGCKISMSKRDSPHDREPMYYCTLSERKFNNEKLKNKECTVKKSTTVKETDRQITKVILDTLESAEIIKSKFIDSSAFNQHKSEQSISTYKLSKESELESQESEIIRIEEAITRLETKYLLGEYTSDSMYLKIKNELLSKLKNSNIKLEYIQAELDRIANQNQWLHWVDECAKLINYNRCNSIDKETKDDSNAYGNCTFQEITYNSKETDYIENKSNIGFPYQMLENLLSNTLESIKVDYNHEHNIDELDIKLHLPITRKPSRILSKSPFKNTQIKTTILTQKPTLKHEKRGLNYSTVTLLARFLGWSTSHSNLRAMWYANSCNGTTDSIGLSIGITSGT